MRRVVQRVGRPIESLDAIVAASGDQAAANGPVIGLTRQVVELV